MTERFLHRNDAPFGEKLWAKIDETVVAAAKSQMTARRMLPTQGPFGLGMRDYPSQDKPLDEKTVGSAKMTAPCVMPLVMIYSKFSLPIRDVAAFEECGMPIDLGRAAAAAIDCARQEDALLFNGAKSLGLEGLTTASGGHSIKLSSWDNVGTAAEDMIRAITAMDKAGFPGPYTLALSPDLYNFLFRRYPQGNQTELEHIGQMITDSIVKAPGISSGGVLLCSCGQCTSIVLGRDLVTSFIGPTGNTYEFMVSESIALCLNQPEAICVLKK